MAQKRIGIIMYGVTGRMGTNQHLVRSILAIQKQGGVALKNGDRLMPDPILVGRNADKVKALAEAHGVKRWTTDLAGALKNPEDSLFFDAASTQMRPKLLKQAIKAGKPLFIDKPVAGSLADALEIYQLAQEAKVPVFSSSSPRMRAGKFALNRSRAISSANSRAMPITGPGIGTPRPRAAASEPQPTSGRLRDHRRGGLPAARSHRRPCA